jgi:hypothetical protein
MDTRKEFTAAEGKIIIKSVYDVTLKCFANLSYADLSGAYLSGVNLSDANLSGVYFSGANLSDANLSDANLSGANLSGANLSGANLSGANLSGANLSGADFSVANLSDADLSGANFYDAKIELSQIKHLFWLLPEEGEIIVWKKCIDGLVKLLIPSDAEKSCCTNSRKCRASKAKVLQILDFNNNQISKAYSHHDSNFIYELGKIVIPDSFDSDFRKECSNGIHFFLIKQEAINY